MVQAFEDAFGPGTAKATKVEDWERSADNIWETGPAGSLRDAVAKGSDIPKDAQASTPLPVEPTGAIFAMSVPVRELSMRTEGIVNGRRVEVLNDSGASMSVIALDECKRLGLYVEEARKHGMSVTNPNGQPFVVQGTAKFDISFQGKVLEVDAVVLQDITVPLILGEAFFIRYNCELSYGTGTVVYDGAKVPVIGSGDYRSKAYRATDGVPVVAAKDIVIEARSVATIRGRVTMPQEFPLEPYVWHFEPLTRACTTLGIAIPDAVVRMVNATEIGIRIFNMKPDRDAVTITAGTVLGTLRVIDPSLWNGDAEGSLPIYHVTALAAENPAKTTNESPKEPSTAVLGAPTVEWTPQHDAEFEELLEGVIEGLPAHTTDIQREEMRTLLREYKTTLHSPRIGLARDFVFDIETDPHARPVCHGERRWSQPERDAIKSQIEAMAAQGLIEPSTSPWSSRLVCVPKKSAGGEKTEVRVCVDFRDVNALCAKDAYPAPNVETVIDRLNEAAWFSSIDLQKGYHQIPLTERAKDICSFRCPFGFYRYTRLPFGVMNAPAYFQRMMDSILQGLTWTTCMVYMDDVIIFAKTWEEHLARLRAVLDRLRAAGLTCGFKKCRFGKEQIAYLGHVVSAKGVQPDDAKARAVQAFVRPTTLAGMRSFLGLTGVFHKFVFRYGDIVRPLHAMTRADEALNWRKGTVWTPERIVAFDAIKDAVCKGNLLLTHPDYSKPMFVVCDASDYGVGAMLAQLDDDGITERPIAFMSAAFTGPAKRYTTTEKEGLAVVWAVASFRPYIHGVPTIVVTDHASLTHILSRGNPPPRIAHWVMDLAEYDLHYVHRKGAHNHVADALSRLQSVLHAEDVIDGSGEAQPPEVVFATNVTRFSMKTRKRMGKGRAGTHLAQIREEKDPEAPTAAAGPAGGQEEGLLLRQEGSLEEGAAAGKAQPEARQMTPTEMAKATNDNKTARLDANGGKETEAAERAVLEKEHGGTVATPMPTLDGGTMISVQQFVRMQMEDTALAAMINFLKSGKEPEDYNTARWVRAQADNFVIQETVLKRAEVLRRGPLPTVRLLTVVPAKLRKDVLNTYHDSPQFGGHMSAERTCARIKLYFWWPRIYSDVCDYVAACITCRLMDAKGASSKLMPHVSPRRPFENMAVDLLAMPVSSAGNRYAMVAMDYFSRYAIVVPLPDKKACTVAKAIMEKVILVHGHPIHLLSDRGGEFLNDIMDQMCKAVGTTKKFTTPYHPQADGMVERFNRTLLKLIGSFVDPSHLDWDVVLPYVLYAYNTSVAEATQEIPFTIIFGRDPPAALYADVLEATGQLRRCADPASWRAEVRRFLSDEFLEQLRADTASRKEKEQAAANKSRKRPAQFEPGTVVLIANKKAVSNGQKPKLMRKNRGLFIVVRHISPVTVEVRKVADNGHALRAYHIDLVTPLRKDKSNLLVTKDASVRMVHDEPPDLTEPEETDKEEFEVQAVTGMRLNPMSGGLEFKVRWKKFSAKDDSWLPERELSCPQAVESYIDSHATLWC